MSPKSPGAGSQPTAKACLGHPEGGGPSGLEEFGKVTSSPHLLRVGFPPPSSFHRVSTPWEGGSLNSRFAHLVIIPGDKGKAGGREGMRHKLQVIGQAHSTLISNQEEVFPESLGCP